MKANICLFLVFIMFVISCKNKQKLELKPYDELINNPMSAAKILDTTDVPKIYFPEPKFDFGTIQQGDSIAHEYTFFNTGKKTLHILSVNSACGCTVSKVYKDKLEPGDSSKIKVVFNSKDKIDFQEKAITILANTFPPGSQITISGFVTN